MRTHGLLILGAAFLAVASGCATAEDSLPPIGLLGTDAGAVAPGQNLGSGGSTAVGQGGSPFGGDTGNGGFDTGSSGGDTGSGGFGIGGVSLGGSFGSGGLSLGGSGGLSLGGTTGAGGSSCFLGICPASGGTTSTGGASASGGGTGTDPTLKAQCAQKICVDPVFDCLLEGCGFTAVCTGFICVVP